MSAPAGGFYRSQFVGNRFVRKGDTVAISPPYREYLKKLRGNRLSNEMSSAWRDAIFGLTGRLPYVPSNVDIDPIVNRFASRVIDFRDVIADRWDYVDYSPPSYIPPRLYRPLNSKYI